MSSIDILLENKDFLVINKPAGLVVHPSASSGQVTDGKTTKETLVDWILQERPEIAGVGEPMTVDGVVINRPGIVHRLDEETSGALIIAKTQKSFEYFKQQFKDRTIKKEYHAFVWGHFREASGIIDEPIGRNKGDFRRWHAGRGVRGELRDAITDWKVAHEFVDEAYAQGTQAGQFSFMHLFPQTGRTHQLRVHMKYLQRPIVSDSLYAPTRPAALGFPRLALHARRISFVDPSGEPVSVEAPYPPDFVAALAKYCNV